MPRKKPEEEQLDEEEDGLTTEEEEQDSVEEEEETSDEQEEDSTTEEESSASSSEDSGSSTDDEDETPSQHLPATEAPFDDVVTGMDVPTIPEVEVPKDERITKPFLTKYEKTRIIGTRAQQISDGSMPMVAYKEDETIDPVELAVKELRSKTTPLVLRRKFPGGRFETWKISELEDNNLD